MKTCMSNKHRLRHLIHIYMLLLARGLLCFYILLRGSLRPRYGTPALSYILYINMQMMARLLLSLLLPAISPAFLAICFQLFVLHGSEFDDHDDECDVDDVDDWHVGHDDDWLSFAS